MAELEFEPSSSVSFLPLFSSSPLTHSSSDGFLDHMQDTVLRMDRWQAHNECFHLFFFFLGALAQCLALS